MDIHPEARARAQGFGNGADQTNGVVLGRVAHQILDSVVNIGAVADPLVVVPAQASVDGLGIFQHITQHFFRSGMSQEVGASAVGRTVLIFVIRYRPATEATSEGVKVELLRIRAGVWL